MKASLKRLITGMERGWETCPHMSHEIYYNYEWILKNYNLRSACAIGHAALGLYGTPRDFSIVEHEYESIRVENPTYEPFSKSLSTYVGDIKGYKTIDLPTAINLLVAPCDKGGYNWTTPQVIEWLKSHLND